MSISQHGEEHKSSEKRLSEKFPRRPVIQASIPYFRSGMLNECSAQSRTVCLMAGSIISCPRPPPELNASFPYTVSKNKTLGAVVKIISILVEDSISSIFCNSKLKKSYVIRDR